MIMLTFDEDFQILDLTCDLCGHMDTYDGKWNECIKDAKMDGWSLYLVGSETEWESYCIDCGQLKL